MVIDMFQSIEELLEQADQADADFIKHDIELQMLRRREAQRLERERETELVYKAIAMETAQAGNIDEVDITDQLINQLLDIIGEEVGK
jgi:hypothetical protein